MAKEDGKKRRQTCQSLCHESSPAGKLCDQSNCPATGGQGIFAHLAVFSQQTPAEALVTTQFEFV
jgi:hypothetical protein